MFAGCDALGDILTACSPPDSTLTNQIAGLLLWFNPPNWQTMGGAVSVRERGQAEPTGVEAILFYFILFCFVLFCLFCFEGVLEKRYNIAEAEDGACHPERVDGRRSACS